MKKLLLALSITGALLLTACSNEEEKTKESTKDKTEQDDKKKETKKDDRQEAKASDKGTKEVPASQETQPSLEEQPVQDEQPSQQDPVESVEEPQAPEDSMDTENMPNGDAMFDMPGSADGYYSNDQLDPETGLPKDDAVPHKNSEGPTDEEIAEGEKEALREKYNGGLSSGEMQTKTAIEQGYYDGPNEDEVMAEIEQSEQEIADGKYDEYK